MTNIAETYENDRPMMIAGGIAGMLLGNMPASFTPDSTAIRPVLLLNIAEAAYRDDETPYTAANILPLNAGRQIEIARVMMAALPGTEFKHSDFNKIGIATSDAGRALTGMTQRGLVQLVRKEGAGKAATHWYTFNPRWANITLPTRSDASLKRAELTDAVPSNEAALCKP